MLAALLNIKNILIVAVIVAIVWLFTSWKHLGEENVRIKANYENALFEKEQQFTEFKFEKNQELQHYLELSDTQTSGLKEQLKQTNIKLNRITQIVSTSIRSRDTIINTIDLDSLAVKIKSDKSFVIPIEDKTDCFYFKAQFVYENGTSRIEVLDRQYTDTINQVSHWERKQWRFLFIKSRLFGKKVAKVTLFNKCGDVKTITINKK